MKIASLLYRSACLLLCFISLVFAQATGSYTITSVTVAAPGSSPSVTIAANLNGTVKVDGGAFSVVVAPSAGAPPPDMTGAVFTAGAGYSGLQVGGTSLVSVLWNKVGSPQGGSLT